MSSNKLKYDNCQFMSELNQSMSTANWILDSNRFENNTKCFNQFGLLGGTTVSHAKGNIIDIESDLMGTTRLNSKCPTNKYLNPCPQSSTLNACQPKQIIIQQTPNQQRRVVNLQPVHLKQCQMVNYQNKLPNRYYPVRK
jgi:hypothetical protein